MLYLNQLDFPNIPYYHNADHGGPAPGRGTVASSGCGLCSACMVVNHLTGRELSVTDCVEISETCGANRGVGTDLQILGPVLAEKFGLDYAETSDCEKLLAHLNAGGEAIEIVFGARNGVLGLFSRVRHYITLVCAKDRIVQILDPSFRPGKYDEECRRSRVSVEYPFVYASVEELEHEGDHNVPLYYLFKKKED